MNTADKPVIRNVPGPPERGQTGEEHWLCQDVARAYDRVKSGETGTIPAARMFDELRARHAQKRTG